MTYRSHRTAPNRVFDHLYDPLFTTSSWKDVARKNMICLRRSAPVQIFPVYQNMFTELSYQPRNQYTLLQNSVPYQEMPLQEDFRPATDITGAERAKFFANPLSNVHTLNVHLVESPTPAEQGPRFVTRGCQTQFRESSAQTVPWMPPGMVHGDKTPELVNVATLIEGFEMPGVKEIEIIERARKKLEWEGQILPPETPEAVEKHEPILEAFEFDVWMQREAEIEKCQEMRMQMVFEMMAERERRNQEHMDEKIEKSCRQIQLETDLKLEKLRLSHQRKLRKLEKKHKRVVKAPKKESELSEQIIETITVPLPPKRRVSPTLSKFESDYLSKTEYKPVSDVKKYLASRDPLWKPKEEVKETQRGLWSDKVLGELYESLKHFRQMNESRNMPTCKVLISSPTDSGSSSPSQEQLMDENAYQNAVLLQKYIKGRAVQNLMWRGRDQFNDLIDELQASQPLKCMLEPEPVEAGPSEVTEEEGSGEGIRPNCHIMLDYLSREIDRLQSERRAHAEQLLEDRERQRAYSRKEEEVYRSIFKAEHDLVATYLDNVLMDGITVMSEEEARLRIKEISEGPQVAQILKYQIIPEVLSRIPDSSYDLISDVLNDFLSYNILKKLEAQQLDTLEDTTSFMNEFVVPELLDRAAKHNVWTETQKEEMQVTSELIQQFVAPEIFKILAREKQKRSRQAHLLAAHDAIWQAIEEMPDPTPPPEPAPLVQPGMSLEETEVMHVIDDCIYRALKLVHENDTEDDEAEISQMNLQKEILNRIVANLNEKMQRQMEAQRLRSSSRTSVDIYLTSERPGTDDDDDD